MPKKEDALPGSPISRLARWRFDPLGFAFVEPCFQPFQGWGRNGRSLQTTTRSFKIGPADSDIVCRNSRAEVVERFTEKESVFRLECAKRIKNHLQILSKNQIIDGSYSDLS